MNLSNYLDDLLKGTVSKGFISTNLPCGGRFRSNTLGVLEFTPSFISDDSKAFVYSCGIHGNETAPIEIMNDLVRDIYEGNIKLKNPLMIIFGHLEAMKNGVRFLNDNLNRMFSDHHKNYPGNNIETIRAIEIQKEITNFFYQYSNYVKVHYDLHTAIRPSKYKRFAIHPFLGEQRSYSHEQVDILASMGLEAIIFMNKPSSTLSYYSSETHNAHAFTLELGKVEKFGKNNRKDFLEAESVLRSLISNKKIEKKQRQPLLCKVKKELIRHEESYKFYISDDTANFTEFQKGDLLASDSTESYSVEEDGEMVAFPNGKVKVGQRSALIITKIKALES